MQIFNEMNSGTSEPQQETSVQMPEMKPYVQMLALDEEQLQTMNDWINGPQVTVNYGYDPDTGYQHKYIDGNGREAAALICGVSPIINGVMWPIKPGRNVIPRPVYEYILSCPEQQHLFSEVDDQTGIIKAGNIPTPGQSNYLGTVY
jgi:hypothetical protein